jgi:hypothetical protein
MVKQEIEWHFSPPLAPHFGGVWESLVKSAKVALEAIVESRPLTEELLRGFVIQAESLLNGRPLTYVSVDPRDPEPLTPNHFLLAQNSPNTEDDVIEDENCILENIGKLCKSLRHTFGADGFKNIFPHSLTVENGFSIRRIWLWTIPCLWWPRILLEDIGLLVE